MKAVKQTPEWLLVKIEVSPQSNKFQITGYNPWRETLEIKIKAPPTKGKANKEIIKELSTLTQSPVEIISGHKSRLKTLKIYDLSKSEFLRILKELKVEL